MNTSVTIDLSTTKLIQEAKLKLKERNKIVSEHYLDSKGKAQQVFTNECARHMDKYIPFQSGTLKNIKVVNHDNIRYLAPYARYQWGGKVMEGPAPKKVTNYDLVYRNSPRGAHWEETMWKNKGQEITKTVRNAVK